MQPGVRYPIKYPVKNPMKYPIKNPTQLTSRCAMNTGPVLVIPIPECRQFSMVEMETTVRQNMGRTFWWLATEVMVNILR
jgi:hypothetical protein